MTTPDPSDPRAAEDDLLLEIVHDLRALLRRSLTPAQLLQRSATGLDPKDREYLLHIVESNREMDGFLGRLSDFANAGRSRAERPVSLEAALRIAVLRFPAVQLDLAHAPKEALDRIVSPQIAGVFAELIDNALKFSGGGEVTIRVELPCAVKIYDSGCGIDDSQIEKIFLPLTKLHSRDAYPGFGLGLAIARRIAVAAGCSVTLSSGPAGGTIASIIFDETT